MKRNWLLIMGVCLLSMLIAYRSYVIPFTHDEASTWLNYRHLNVWSCISNAACWGTANNHWLNTLLLQWSAGLLGDQVWALRLPNVIAGIGYIICAALIAVRYIKIQSLQLAGYFLLCGHVYLLDFFSLARGYGLMTSGVIWGIYFMLRYIEFYNKRWLVFCLLALSFSVLGNFTGLLSWSAMACGWMLWLISKKKYALLIHHGVWWLLNGGVLLLLLYFPIKTLAGSGEFGWGAENIWTMLKDLMVNLLYGAHYFGDSTSFYLLIALIICTILILGVSRLNNKKEIASPVMFMALLLALNLGVIFLQQKITGSLAPVGRKSIYLIPVIFGLFSLSLALIRNRKTGWILGLCISILLVIHMIGRLPLRSCREWYYDAYYSELIADLFPKGSHSDSLRLGTTWIFNPSLQFYQKTIPLPVSGLEYQKPLVIDSTMQYYYIETQDSVGMNAGGFGFEKKIGPFLLMKKNVPVR